LHKSVKTDGKHRLNGYIRSVRSLWQRTAMMLVALTWLPQMFFAPPVFAEAAVTQGKGSAAALCTRPFPTTAAPFHQLRSSGLHWCCSKLTGLDSTALGGQPIPDVCWVGTAWQPTPAPSELLNTWHLCQRAALFPRAPSLS
jgi:hypothetical protein